MSFRSKNGTSLVSGPEKLIYSYVSGKGSAKYGKDFKSENPADFEFKASMRIGKKDAAELDKLIIAFWNAHKPEKVAAPTSTFLKAEMIDGTKKDKFGKLEKVESGSFIITASTNTCFGKGADLKMTSIKLLNSKGVEIPKSHELQTGTVGVGEGSEGFIHGKMAITEYEGKAYVKYYLAGVQFTKFVPYEGDGIDAVDVEVEDDGLGGDGLDVQDESQGDGPAV
ncbi:MAG: hypothetical protein J7M03_06945 [Candidatus Desulfofervidaceae bacterium]|nr:hypothetical protein [Candidatus Desulfofervidaceae bacterium]